LKVTSLLATARQTLLGSAVAVPRTVTRFLAGSALACAALSASADTVSDGANLGSNPKSVTLESLRGLSSADTVVLDRSGRVVNLGFGLLNANARPRESTTLRLSSDVTLESVQSRLDDGAEISVLTPPARLSPSSNGAGFYVGARWELSEDIRLRVGNSIALDQQSVAPAPYALLPRDLAARISGETRVTQNQIASLEWAPTNWSSIAFSATRSREQDSFFGTALSGAIGTASAAQTSSLGISARVGFGDGWVTTVAYAEGVSQLDLSSSGLVANLNPLRSKAYGIAIAKQGLLGDDTLGISVSRPLQVYSGTLTGMNISALNPGLAASAGSAPESDVQLGYVTTFMDGALALQANAAYQINANGDKGENAVTGVARARINF